jgi:two-component system sensor histidine kinase GlrK
MRIVLDEFAELNGLAAELSWASQRFVAARLGEILRDAREAQRAVPWQMGGLVAVTVSLSVVLAGLIAHPVRRTVEAIRKLGDGSFDKPIEIGGPPELAALGHQLDWLRRRLLQLEQDKDRFLRNVSHELKTPLASIREGAELLTDGSAGPLNATQDEIARILNEAGAELQLLIENLLTYDPERLREGRLSPAVVDLGSFLAKIIARHRLVTARKCVDIHLDCPPLELDADPEKFAVLFDNLVSNAVKFAAKGGRVCIEVVGDNDFVTVDVLDDGPGVASGDRDRIFQPFCQGHAAGETKVRGSGLGLAVARECAELHDGSLDVMDSPEGACFRVLLPRTRAKNVA